MFAIAHLEKFISDRPTQFRSTGQALLTRARAAADEDGNLASLEAEELLGKSAVSELAQLVGGNQEYIAICFKASATARARRGE